MFILKNIDGSIITYANFKFNDACIETNEEICIVTTTPDKDDILLLKSDYDLYMSTTEYIEKELIKNNIVLTNEKIKQIKELEEQQFRSLKSKTKGTNTKEDDAKFDEYETQIETIRAEIKELK
jgi:hypothetical protein